LFVVTIKISILKASPVVNRCFLPIFTQPNKITGILCKAFPVDLSTGRMLKTGFDRVVGIDQIIIQGKNGICVSDERRGIMLWAGIALYLPQSRIIYDLFNNIFIAIGGINGCCHSMGRQDTSR
jgi:hypothetical protein